MYNFAINFEDNTTKNANGQTNYQVIQTDVKLFLCPSAPAGRKATGNVGPGYAVSDYSPTSSIYQLPPANPYITIVVPASPISGHIVTIESSCGRNRSIEISSFVTALSARPSICSVP